MAYLPGTSIPQEWFYPLPIIIAIIIAFLIFRARRGGGEEEPEAPLQTDLVAMTPVDQSGNPVLGRLLATVTLTDKDLLVTDPEILDEQTSEPKVQRVPCEDVVPWQGKDATGNMVRLWLVVKKKGELVAVSFSNLLSEVRQRFDPLESDPYDVGRHYIGGPPHVGGVAQLLQSTTGKVIVLGAAWLIGLMMGILIIAGHVGHF